MTTSLQLVMEVRYLLNGETISALRSNLDHAAGFAIDRGLLTGDGPAVVEEYSYQVAVVPPELLVEDQIASFLKDRIDSGETDLSDIPRLMARYGLMDPLRFDAEMRERMGIGHNAVRGFAVPGDQDDPIVQIARKHFGMKTLESRNLSILDFHDVAVWDVRQALEAAFNLGLLQGRQETSGISSEQSESVSQAPNDLEALKTTT